ncbi:MAG: FK506-binding protein [Parcubacteria group bacterium ADurb.Bin247]|jgi:hypothetical protein|nr:MAG: FK506-binding protein [Parcubacteria group bacterium ADurb.Bin247]
MKKYILLVILILISFFFYFNQKEDKEIIDLEFSGVGLANPAFVYCIEQGGTSEKIVTDKGENSYCVFSDNSKCWEWDFFRGDCDKGQMFIEILKESEINQFADSDDLVSVHYVGTLLDGTEFDSSVKRGVPFEFKLGAGQVIPGWDQGVLGMRVGEIRKLTLAPELAYGNYEVSPLIPTNSTLIFEIELLDL